MSKLQVQKSFDHTGGILYIVGTPIGNLDDWTPRAKNAFETADVIAAEDTRHTQKLLNRFGIRKPLISYHEHNRHTREKELIDRLKQGETVALVSDAGMPGISDPGEELIRSAIACDIPVIPVPGPNAAVTALVASGLPPQPFLFLGFLPRNTREREEVCRRWRRVEATLVCYEAPHRLKAMLQTVLEVMGDRRVALARELTKRHEEWLRGTVSECLQWLEDHPPRGEYTVVIAGWEGETPSMDDSEETAWWQSLTVIEHVKHYLAQGETKKVAIQRTAQDRGLPKREVYNLYHREQD